MSYGVEFDPKAETYIYSWDLDEVLCNEVYRHLDEELSERPTKYLRDVGGTMQYSCRVLHNGVQHLFVFRVRYSQSEETLIIWQCFYYPLR